MSIVVLGAVFIDIKGHSISSYIPAGRNVGTVEEVHGGVSRNVVEDIANVELRPKFVSLVDESAIGAGVLDKLTKHKVDTRFVRKTADGMGKWLAVFDNHGDVVASISKRPDLSAINDILDEEGDEIFHDADSIALEMDMEKETIKRVFKYAEKYNLKVYAAVSNMSIAVERRDFLKNVECFVCNQQEAGILFMDDYSEKTPENMQEILSKKLQGAQIKKMIVTMGGVGAVYADIDGNTGFVPARKVDVKDTTGAGDSFFAGVTIGLTYGKSLEESCEIGSKLAASVIVTSDNVCPRFLPSEFGIDVPENE
ncbi:MAG: carbohydrate kinase family protein [Lachnospiraceae bacterium]|jgi:pseudouridine kinase|nr:carbohydrate kinase family protein [Lachnospiraceae bacterium]